MNGALRVLNRQRVRPIDARLLKQMIRALLSRFPDLTDFDLTVHLVNASAMATLNETHLGHKGSTDVITLDYSGDESETTLTGEIFVSIDDALQHAARFHSCWQSELARYVIHGILHLRGHDDLRPNARRRMKREETRLLKDLDRRFRLSNLGRKRKVPS